jgi:anti-sigma regulatory factor (Ser/Thr protein kinase)
VAEPGASATSLRRQGCEVTELPAVRRWLRRRLPDRGRATDAELVVTELVANAADHGGGASGLRITVSEQDGVHIEVDDGDPSAMLTVGHSRLGGYRGKGLAIIDAVASWGVVRTRTGKTVWAEL